MKLEGIKVIDLSMFLPGPLLTQMMSDQGADVIKIESLHEGEPNRVIGATRDGVTVFCAGVARDERDRLVTSGGRVLSVTATDSTLSAARDRAYAAVAEISWPGMYVRPDIAAVAAEVAEEEEAS